MIDEEEGDYELIDLDKYFVGGDNGRPLEVGLNPVRSRRLKGSLDVRHRDAGLIDGVSKLNQGIVAATKGGAGHPWPGPIVVVKHVEGHRGIDMPYEDMDMEDFRDAVD